MSLHRHHFMVRALSSVLFSRLYNNVKLSPGIRYRREPEPLMSGDTHTRTHTHTHTRTHARTHARARTHTHTHAHTHARTHTHTNTHKLSHSRYTLSGPIYIVFTCTRVPDVNYHKRFRTLYLSLCYVFPVLLPTFVDSTPALFASLCFRVQLIYISITVRPAVEKERRTEQSERYGGFYVHLSHKPRSLCEPIWPSGKATYRHKDRLRFKSIVLPLFLQKCGLWRLALNLSLIHI